MGRRVYFISVGWSIFVPESAIARIDRALDAMGDWIRLNDRTWLCSTTYSSDVVYNAIRYHDQGLNRILVIVLDPSDRFGLAPDWLWQWIDGQRQEPPKTAAAIIEAFSTRQATEQAKKKIDQTVG
jgi:hypothetical protein